MNEEIDLEQMLSRSTPLPCSVDSMELMFAAGIEQQKKKSTSHRSWMIFVSVTSCVFLVSTMTLGIWLYGLKQENRELFAMLEQSRQNEVQNPSGLLLTNQPVREDEKESVDLVPHHQHPNHDKSNNDSEKWVNQSRDGKQFVNTTANGSTGVGGTNKDYWLRGVALRPEDEYRNPVENYGSQIPSNGGSEVGSIQSNLQLRNQIQGVLLGL